MTCRTPQPGLSHRSQPLGQEEHAGAPSTCSLLRGSAKEKGSPLGRVRCYVGWPVTVAPVDSAQGRVGLPFSRSTGLLYRGGRYFDPTLGIWLALGPLVVIQGWRKRRKRKGRREMKWYVLVALLVVGVGGVLVACGPGSEPTPWPTSTELPSPIPPSLTPWPPTPTPGSNDPNSSEFDPPGWTDRGKMARAVFGEASIIWDHDPTEDGPGERAIIAVGWSAIHRLENDPAGYFPDTLGAVLNEDAYNGMKEEYSGRAQRLIDIPGWHKAVELTDLVLSRQATDYSKGCVWFHDAACDPVNDFDPIVSFEAGGHSLSFYAYDEYLEDASKEATISDHLSM